jgi:hypothetical protein
MADIGPVVTGPQDCNCANICPGYSQCICIADLEEHSCRFYCYGAARAAKRVSSDLGPESAAVDDKIPLDRRVRLEMRGASLGEAGALISETVDADIYVPAHRIDERRDLLLEDVSLETIVRELGLMALVRPQRDGPR